MSWELAGNSCNVTSKTWPDPIQWWWSCLFAFLHAPLWMGAAKWSGGKLLVGRNIFRSKAEWCCVVANRGDPTDTCFRRGMHSSWSNQHIQSPAQSCRNQWGDTGIACWHYCVAAKQPKQFFAFGHRRFQVIYQDFELHGLTTKQALEEVVCGVPFQVTGWLFRRQRRRSQPGRTDGTRHSKWWEQSVEIGGGKSVYARHSWVEGRTSMQRTVFTIGWHASLGSQWFSCFSSTSGFADIGCLFGCSHSTSCKKVGLHSFHHFGVNCPR